MKHLFLWYSTTLTGIVVLFMGCAANAPGQLVTEEGIVRPKAAAPQLDNAHAPVSSTTATIGGAKAAGFVVHIDPATGEFHPEPPPDRSITPQAARAPEPQFFEIPSTVPGGGVVVELKGHFRAPLIATIGSDGKVELKHKSTSPAAAQSK